MAHVPIFFQVFFVLELSQTQRRLQQQLTTSFSEQSFYYLFSQVSVSVYAALLALLTLLSGCKMCQHTIPSTRGFTGCSCVGAMVVETSDISMYVMSAGVQRIHSKYDANYLAGR